MTWLAIAGLVLLALIVVLFLGGFVATDRRARLSEPRRRRKIAAADRALASAAALDRGWDRERLDSAARGALERERPDFSYDQLHLVHVDDRPGTNEDRAQMSAVGPHGDVGVLLVRRGDEWIAERVG